MGAPIQHDTAAGEADSKEKTAEGNFKIYAPELQLILWLRQQRNLLTSGENLRCEIEIGPDHSHIEIVNLAQFRRIVLAS